VDNGGSNGGGSFKVEHRPDAVVMSMHGAGVR